MCPKIITRILSIFLLFSSDLFAQTYSRAPVAIARISTRIVDPPQNEIQLNSVIVPKREETLQSIVANSFRPINRPTSAFLQEATSFRPVTNSSNNSSPILWNPSAKGTRRTPPPYQGDLNAIMNERFP